MTEWLSFWYDWGVFVGVFIAATVAVYIFFDSRQEIAPGRATLPRILSIIGLVMTLSSLYYRLTKTGEGTNLIALFEADNNFSLFLYLALAGTLLALGALIYYLMSVRREEDPSGLYACTEPSYSPLLMPPSLPAEVAPSPTMIGGISSDHRLRVKTEVLNGYQGPMAFLIDIQTGRQFRLAAGTTIGSAFGNDIILDETTVSGQHAKVKLEDGTFALFDLASTNGTTVNGELITRHILADGDKIQMGRKFLAFRAIDESFHPNKRDTEALARAGKQIQSMRLDAAVPEEAVVDCSFEVAVAIKQIESRLLNVPGLDKVRSEKFQVQIPTGASSAQLQVHIQAADCRIIGPSSQRFDLYVNSDSPSPTLYFTLIPLREGEISILVKVTQLWFAVLGSARLGLIIRESLAGAVKASVKSLPIKPPSDDPFSILLPDLLRFIDNNFSIQEVKKISFEMRIDYDELSGDQKSGKIMELILYCRRRDCLEELIERIIQARPNRYEQILST